MLILLALAFLLLGLAAVLYSARTPGRVSSVYPLEPAVYATSEVQP
jgi:hypothetical protein